MGEKEWEHFLDCCPCDIIIPRTTILSQKEHTMSFINRVRYMWSHSLVVKVRFADSWQQETTGIASKAVMTTTTQGVLHRQLQSEWAMFKTLQPFRTLSPVIHTSSCQHSGNPHGIKKVLMDVDSEEEILNYPLQWCQALFQEQWWLQLCLSSNHEEKHRRYAFEVGLTWQQNSNYHYAILYNTHKHMST